jgi:hypothetical protein
VVGLAGVGDWVGAAVGALVGAAVGALVGALVGAAVGALVGAARWGRWWVPQVFDGVFELPLLRNAQKRH